MATGHSFPPVNSIGRSAAHADPRRQRKSFSDGPLCNTDPYPRIAAGEYTLRCIEATSYLDPQFRRQVCRLAFSSPLVHDGVVLYGFINLGDPAKCPGRRSRYWKAWVKANCGTVPRRGQTMTPRVFNGCWFRVYVVDVDKDSDGAKHGPSAIYSIVREILELAHV